MKKQFLYKKGDDIPAKDWIITDKERKEILSSVIYSDLYMKASLTWLELKH